MANVTQFPDDLPIPQDDGAADHLSGMPVPHVELPSTDGSSIDLANLVGTSVVYIYPMTGRPDRDLPEGWNEIPGARGCTPQSCSFRDHADELKQLGVNQIFGISTQDTDYQREARDRLQLPFELLSDLDGKFRRALRLPTFEVDGTLLLKRMALIISDGKIVKCFYPVFPPDRNASDVVAWLKVENEAR